MTIQFDALKSAPRLLVEIPLKPIQGSRFQPTGFPDLGAATFKGFNGAGDPVDCLLVESAQSVANRLESVCWDEGNNSLVSPLNGLPYVQTTLPDGTVTDSIREAHRLNSPYIASSKSPEFDAIKDSIGFEANKPFNRQKLAKALLKYDPCSLLHGTFLEKLGGVVRLPRVISGFVEAEGIEVASAGGVKFDRVQPGTGENTPYGKAAEGYGNVPYHRDEYTARSIVAYFNLDLAQLRGYGLGENAECLLIAISLYKIRKFLSEGLRLRTACDLEATDGIIVKRPLGFDFPELEFLESELPGLVQRAADEKLFADPAVTQMSYKK
ncbi:type I-G CRISPR-associated RAMP protein Csb1/Cas7g [Allorhodopirellula heiligendammensis]|uniref:CRISPR-associated protein n=1 Tax=Allorhodopirellula heiligendammensis TaxID=2714739 RepID=A0A5C6C1F1_9BACT|nr:type I-U CRISPR-associated RAMP protein Csb1/Cas7u [Allorhodopirellula heiligendammensis]TWU17962.1 CRISPR-associated protein [Allorhodopirellula heiligendammensis]